MTSGNIPKEFDQNDRLKSVWNTLNFTQRRELVDKIRKEQDPSSSDIFNEQELVLDDGPTESQNQFSDGKTLQFIPIDTSHIQLTLDDLVHPGREAKSLEQRKKGFLSGPGLMDTEQGTLISFPREAGNPDERSPWLPLLLLVKLFKLIPVMGNYSLRLTDHTKAGLAFRGICAALCEDPRGFPNIKELYSPDINRAGYVSTIYRRVRRLFENNVKLGLKYLRVNTDAFGNDSKSLKGQGKSAFVALVTSLSLDGKKLKTLLNTIMRAIPDMFENNPVMLEKAVRSFGVEFNSLKALYGRKVREDSSSVKNKKNRKKKTDLAAKPTFEVKDWVQPSDSTFLYGLENKLVSLIVKAFWPAFPDNANFYKSVLLEGYPKTDRLISQISQGRKRIVEAYTKYTNSRVKALKAILGSGLKDRGSIAKEAPALLKMNMAALVPKAPEELLKSFELVLGTAPFTLARIKAFVQTWTQESEMEYLEHKSKKGNTILNFAEENKAVVFFKDYFKDLDKSQQLMEANLKSMWSVVDAYLLGPKDWKKWTRQNKQEYIDKKDIQCSVIITDTIANVCDCGSIITAAEAKYSNQKIITWNWQPMHMPIGLTMFNFYNAFKRRLESRKGYLLRFIDKSFKYERELETALSNLITRLLNNPENSERWAGLCKS